MLFAREESCRAIFGSPSAMLRLFQTAFVACTLILAACQGDPSGYGAAEEAASPQAPNAMMNFELTSLDGGTIGPGDLGEDLVLVDFWATWCRPCHLQAEILAKLYPEFKSKGIEFLAVSLGEPEEVVREFVAERPFAYPVLIDPQDTVASTYDLFVLPTVVLMDRAGSVMYLHEGISSAARLRSVVDEVLEARRPPSGGGDGSDATRSAS